MRDTFPGAVVRQARLIGLLLLLITMAGYSVAAQPKPQTTVPVIMLSDLHFDPFHDPAKVPLLVKEPVEHWVQILAAPDSPGQTAAFATLQKACKAKEDTDSPYSLLRSSLVAAKERAAGASFVLVSGDLLVHDLDCKYRATMGLNVSTTDDQSASATFAEKTSIFVMKQIESTFSRGPVYIALGNNDSRCNHNRLDPHDAYLKAVASTVMDGMPQVSMSEKTAARSTFESGGYYAVTMPAPMVRTRLIVINDIYLMPKYATCEADENDQTGAHEQMVWLHQQLEESRQRGERVWLLGHLPPAVNPEASLANEASFCTSGRVVKYQSTDGLANEIMAYGDVVKLGVFGHTHMDEFHLLRGDRGGVPIKVVGSVSPVSGNKPSFTLGLVAPLSSELVDYAVYAASNSTGVGTRWTEEYSFARTYDLADFSEGSLSELIGRLRKDKDSASESSRLYQMHFFKGGSGKKLSTNWPAYVCSLDRPNADGFKACVCGTN